VGNSLAFSSRSIWFALLWTSGARRLAKNQSQSKALSPNSSREQALPYPYIYDIYAAGV
jgi:hypothetical protein